MVDNSPGNYVAAKMDPVTLSTPFKVQTSWHVISGATCSGKTTLIDQLAAKGFQTVLETARYYFKREMGKGRFSQEIRDSGYPTQRAIFDMQVRNERRLRPNEAAFLDRGLPDLLTFLRVFGLNPNEILPECFDLRYASVFILDRLPIDRKIKPGPEDDATAEFLDEWLERDYSALGYSVVRVPVIPPQERLGYVLERPSEF